MLVDVSIYYDAFGRYISPVYAKRCFGIGAVNASLSSGNRMSVSAAAALGSQPDCQPWFAGASFPSAGPEVIGPPVASKMAASADGGRDNSDFPPT